MNILNAKATILTILINIQDWITLEDLSILTQLDKKNIKLIIKELKKEPDIQILTNTNKGYKLERIDPIFKENLISTFHDQDCYYYLSSRTIQIYFFLLINDHPVSMEFLSQHFYYSKTIVFLEIQRLKRWIDRIDGITLQVSKVEGVYLNGLENIKRYQIATICPSSLIKKDIPKQTLTNLTNHYPMFEKDFTLLLHESQILISGEDYSRFLKLIIITIYRSQKGFTINEIQPLISPHTVFIKKLSLLITHYFNYQLTQNEINHFSFFLQSLNSFQSKSSSSLDLVNQIEHIILKHLNLDFPIIKDKKELSNQIQSMLVRIETGQKYTNYYKNDLLLQFLFSCHLLDIAFKQLNYPDIPLSELTLLIPLFHNRLNLPQKKYRILIISNQPLSLCDYLQEKIRHIFPYQIDKIEYYPIYKYSFISETYDYYFTTEKEILLTYPFFKPIPLLFSQENKTYMRNHIFKINNRSAIVHYTNSTLLSDQISPLLDSFSKKRSSFFVYRENTLLIIHQSTDSCSITHFSLQKNFLYHHYPLKQIFIIKYLNHDYVEQFLQIKNELQKHI